LRWLALALAGALLALGPFVFLNPGAWRSAPVFYWVWLRDLIPPVRMITSYVRFDVFASLGLAVLAALGADRLIAAAPNLLEVLEIIAAGNTDPDRAVQLARDAVAIVGGAE
jgi:hypothetical protein